MLASWALCSAIAMPLAGRISTRTGLRAYLVPGVALITAGSILAALARRASWPHWPLRDRCYPCSGSH